MMDPRGNFMIGGCGTNFGCMLAGFEVDSPFTYPQGIGIEISQQNVLIAGLSRMSHALHPALIEPNRYTTGVMMKKYMVLCVHKINVLEDGMRRHFADCSDSRVVPLARLSSQRRFHGCCWIQNRSQEISGDGMMAPCRKKNINIAITKEEERKAKA